MTDTKVPPLSVVVYAADWWGHVCPMVRALGPAQQTGVRLIRGNDWGNGEIRVFPERVSEADIVLVQRDFPRHADVYAQVIAQARFERKPVVYELDDLLTELPEDHPDVIHYLGARAAILEAVIEADAVVGSTPQICDYLRTWNPNALLFPNYLHDQLWNIVARPSDEDAVEHRPLVIGYMGGHSHLPDLEMIAPALMDVLYRYGDGVAFKFWGVLPPAEIREFENVEYVNPGLVDYAEFAAYFVEQEVDIFIAPLKDNLFNRSKSHIKFLEYSALGVPGVYSRIAPYERVVVHGQNGFLASSLDEWEAYLVQLIEDPMLRSQLGLAAQTTVREQWLLSDHAYEWAEIYGRITPRTEPWLKSEMAKRITQQLIGWYRDLATHLTESEKRKRELETEVAQQEETIKNLSIYIKDLETHASNLEKLKNQAENVIADITSSKGWELLEAVRAVRLRLAPRGSLRERVLMGMLHAYSVWREEGFRALIRKIVRRDFPEIKHAIMQTVTHRTGPSLSLSVTPGEPCPLPAVSIVVLKEDTPLGLDEQKVLEWSQAQTCHSMIDVVVWGRSLGEAWVEGESGQSWQAPDVQSLCRGLRSPYVCVASHDLLRQNETYLEANLIALHSEGLALTVNLRGQPEWALRLLVEGALPGNVTLPLLRQVVRTDCLRNDFSLDLSAWTEGKRGESFVAGKIISHTTNHLDGENTLPFETSADGVETLLLGRHIVVRNEREATQKGISHVIHPVDSVLPAAVERDSRPTVLLLMPFLAVGGAERLAYNVMRNLPDIRFVVATVEGFDPVIGTTADMFRQITPYVYTAPDFMQAHLNFSFMKYLIARFEPVALYIANGANWIYDALSTLREEFPQLRIINQVYDHQVGWINRYDPLVASLVDAHIGANPNICRAYIEHGVKMEQIHFIEHGIDSDELNPADYPEERKLALKQQLGLPPDGKIVTFAARFHPQKRPMDFVELARRFAADPSVTFLMVGDGPMGETVDRQIAKIGLKNLHRREFYRPISDIYAITDVLVLPSEYEAMPLVVAETQAMGKPVVVTDVGNNREVVEMTKGGVVVPRIGDISALKTGVEKMLRQPPDPAKVRESILARFDVRVIAEKHRQVFLGDENA